MFTSKMPKGVSVLQRLKTLNQRRGRNTHLYQSLETFPLQMWWKLLQGEVSLTTLGLTQAKFNQLYDIYFEEFDSSEWRNLLFYQSRKDKELYKLNILIELMNNFVMVANIGDISSQERAKAGIVEIIKDLFPVQKKINCFSSIEEIGTFLRSMIKSQENVLNTFKKEEEKKAKSVHHVVARIAQTLKIALSANTLTVAEFLAYYKLYTEQIKENG